jgi:hypothetical protein
MEHLFSPCVRFNDLFEFVGHSRMEGNFWEEFENANELNLNVSTEELLSAERGFAYADLYAMFANEDTVVWLNPHAAIVREDGSAGDYFRILNGIAWQVDFTVDGEQVIVLAMSLEALSEICDVVLGLLAVSVVHSVNLKFLRSSPFLINAPRLANLMEQCQSLKALSFESLELDENQIRVLGAYSRPDLEIDLKYCRIEGTAAEALGEVLGRNQGPTKVNFCKVDNFVLADGLRGNSRLKNLVLCLSSSLEVGNQQVLAYSRALSENRGLVILDLTYDPRMSNEAWDAVCGSLRTHPTLEVLYLRANFGFSYLPAIWARDVITSRVKALLDMMKTNLSIHTIDLAYQYSKTELFRESVIPYLETNRFRPRLLAIQKTRPIPYRAKVLGRALLAVQTDPNWFWMLLSGNDEVAFPSTTMTIAAAASVPTPTTTSAIAAAGGATTPLATGPHAAKKFEPAASRKRKTCL